MITRLVLRRVAQAALVFLGASFLVFCMVWLLPGDEIRALFGFRRPPPEVLAELRAAYGLDQPFVLQYLQYIVGFIRGDMGPLYNLDTYGGPGDVTAVNAVVSATLPTTLRIIAVSLVIQLAVALPVGIALGRRPGGRADLAVGVLGVVGVCIPAFVLAALVRRQAVLGLGTTFLESTGWAEALLPGIIAAVVPTALAVRVIRLQTRELAREPWVATLRASGVRERRVIGWFGGRELAATAITICAAEIGPTIAGLLVVEQVFDIGGLGAVLLGAARFQQGPLITGAVITFIAVVVVATMVADIAVLALDPRTRPKS